MFILRDLLRRLQAVFSNTEQGQKSKIWFAYTLLAVVVPFTSSIASNLLRSLNTLFGLEIQRQRYYSFMASPTLPWSKLWETMWSMIPDPVTDGRIIVAADDSINKKSGENIFACGNFHDHTSKGKENRYPWSQCIVAVGLLKKVKDRWACLPLSYRFYLMKKMIESKVVNVMRKGNVAFFQDKMEQVSTMVKEIHHHYGLPVLTVTDSWFGNDGLWSKLDRGADGHFHLLSRMRSNNVLYDFPDTFGDGKREKGRPRKYGNRLGSLDECAARYKDNAIEFRVNLYGKVRTVSAYTQLVMLKTMKCRVRVVWVFRKTRYIALMTTDLTLTVE